MARSPEITSDRLNIVTFSDKYITSRYVGWLNDPMVTRFSDQRFRTHSSESCLDYFRSFDGTPNYFWAIMEKDSGLGHIGNVNAYVDTIHQTADIGILIGEPAARGSGYGLEAWQAVCHYLFSTKAIRKITAGTLSVNLPMLSLMKNAGMLKDGCRTRQCLFEGQEVDIVHYALFNPRST